MDRGAATAAPVATTLKAGWGFGSVGTQVVLFSQSALLLYFFSAVLGLQPGVAGALLFAGKLFDAAMAPLSAPGPTGRARRSGGDGRSCSPARC